MHKISLLATAALLLATPALSQGQGKGQGGGGDGGGKQAGPKHANGGAGRGAGGAGKDRGAKKGGGAEQQGPRHLAQRGPTHTAERAQVNGGGQKGGAAAGERKQQRQEASNRQTKVERPSSLREERGRQAAQAGNYKQGRGTNKDGARIAQGERGGSIVRYADRTRYPAGPVALIEGCPPGLAKKNNGCLPPGQARSFTGYSGPYANWYGIPYWEASGADYDWRYADGYAYRVDRSSTLVTGFLPLLGGALFGGNMWPTSYSDYQVTPYYDDYYGYDDDYDYRYADGAVFSVDPATQAIQAIAGLLTGDDWNVGSAMPTGYDVYNVPPDYRDEYADSDEAWYRYSDGYVYEVDPTTQLVRQAIELLT